MASSVYIHIPFCKQKCKYCSFVSFVNENRKSDYVKSLLKEIEAKYQGESLKTLYFGGGTPSLMDIEDLQKIIDKFNLDENCEITLEMNPDDARLDYLKALREIGVNRLSIGSQTFDDKVLEIIGRRHNSEQILNAVKLAKLAKFENISLDLIYGLPLSNLSEDLEKITMLNIQHISTYGLKIEEDSYWGKFPPENIPDDDAQADMYIQINDFLESKGYRRYEISNFAKEGFESKHNLNYWNNDEYYGFGLAAHGYINGIRYSNCCVLEEYINNPFNSKNYNKQTKVEMLEEEVFLGFRKAEGINLKRIQRKFDVDFEKQFKLPLSKFVPEYIEKTSQGYRLTLKGVLLSNNILSEFLF